MVAFKCPMCTSGDCGKIDDYFVCNHCGTKFTNETVTRLVHEGKVDITGSVVKVEGIDDYHTEMKRGYNHLLLKNYNLAQEVFKELNNRYPEKIEAYKGRIIAETNFFKIDINQFNCQSSFNKKMNQILEKMNTISDTYGHDSDSAFINFDSYINSYIKTDDNLNKSFIELENLRNKFSAILIKDKETYHRGHELKTDLTTVEQLEFTPSEKYIESEEEVPRWAAYSVICLLISAGVFIQFKHCWFIALIGLGISLVFLITTILIVITRNKIRNKEKEDFVKMKNDLLCLKEKILSQNLKIEKIKTEFDKEIATLRNYFENYMGNMK